MIGFFIFDEVPNVNKPLVLAHSELNAHLKGQFYVKDIDCKDISSVKKGDTFFGVLDDASGFGACLFIKDLDVETNALLLQNNLHVKGNATVDGNETINGNELINGKLDVIGNIKTNATVTGNSPNTTINLTAAHAALIVAAGLTGTTAPLPGVQVMMQNS